MSVDLSVKRKNAKKRKIYNIELNITKSGFEII